MIKSYIKEWLKRPFLMVSIFLFFTLIPYFLVSILIKPNHDTYNIDFIIQENLDDTFITYDKLLQTKNLIIDIRQDVINQGKPAPYSDFSYVKVDKMASGGIKLKTDTEFYSLSVKTKFFNSKAQAQRFLKTYIEQNTINPIFNEIGCYQDDISSFLIFGYSSLAGFILSILVIVLIIKINPLLLDDNIKYDNDKIYRTPFHLSFFKKASQELKTVKKLVFLSILFALALIISLINIPSGFQNLGISFSYLVLSLIGLLYGPLWCFLIGFCFDILNFIIKPSGVFFLGYSLSAALGCFIYGLFFYKTKITFTKCLFTRILINIFINALLGSYWWYLVSAKTFDLKDYILLVSLPKNLVYLLPQSIFQFLFLKALMRVLEPLQLVRKEIADNVSLF